MRSATNNIKVDDAFVVQPSDSVLIKDDSNNLNDYPVVGIHYTGATDAVIKVVYARGTTTQTIYATPGSYHPVLVKQIRSTGTTASTGTIEGIVGQYGI